MTYTGYNIPRESLDSFSNIINNQTVETTTTTTGGGWFQVRPPLINAADVVPNERDMETIQQTTFTIGTSSGAYGYTRAEIRRASGIYRPGTYGISRYSDSEDFEMSEIRPWIKDSLPDNRPRLIPTIMDNRLEVNERDLNQIHSFKMPTIFRVRSMKELESMPIQLIVENGISPDELMFFLNKRVIPYLMECGISSHLIHSNLFILNSGSVRIKDSAYVAFNEPTYEKERILACDHGFDTIRHNNTLSEMSVPCSLFPVLFDLSVSDLSWINSIINFQIEEFSIDTVLDVFYLKFPFTRDICIGEIVVMNVEVPGPDLFCNNHYYPRQWEVDAGTRRNLFAFLPTKEGIRNRWVSGIFTPAGNLVPMGLFPGKKYITHRVTRNPKFSRTTRLKYFSSGSIEKVPDNRTSAVRKRAVAGTMEYEPQRDMLAPSWSDHSWIIRHNTDPATENDLPSVGDLISPF